MTENSLIETNKERDKLQSAGVEIKTRTEKTCLQLTKLENFLGMRTYLINCGLLTFDDFS